ncbi:hypothetical protein C477_10243 [Haloterrigena salina JCM 13891]|uniref:Transcription regulator TrmB N-terminal domain-containing protein n=1 Tax=Haloterrigena salina JCM 13891 TaxID=1227488 RepID=M0C5E8_9EURY|nr:hypothetical protein [Haloterrigena salina]ELZ18440.1 hypothetical protein C477_10243 [Haloterrigena salina JCM 13891]
MMSTSEHQPTVPDEFDAPRTKLVYLSVLVLEEATVSELQQLLGLSKLTLLPILRSLVEGGRVRSTEVGYACR